ncbi:hypothetical protein Dsin_009695 [Dipteronia sinensis]|uniref:Uncharacterized protein n=1 Tax=Dipteronia sinensis TaxID=43782 RepID=A0AAE0EDQ0_9ROSI|nr:hypothetical protein Dsin_009695 [Dipteronia sinensis]
MYDYFFYKLNSIVNFFGAYAKRCYELKSIREDEIVDMISLGELEASTRANQIHNLQWPGPTRWSSHFTYVSRLIDMFGSTCTLLEKFIDNGLNSNIRGEAKDFQLMGLDNRFKEETMELLVLSDALNPMNGFRSFKIDSICTLVEIFYPKNLAEDELKALKRQLKHFKFDVLR